MKKIIFIAGGLVLAAVVYDQLARRGYVPKLFVKKTDMPLGEMPMPKPKPRKPIITPFGRVIYTDPAITPTITK